MFQTVRTNRSCGRPTDVQRQYIDRKQIAYDELEARSNSRNGKTAGLLMHIFISLYILYAFYYSVLCEFRLTLINAHTCTATPNLSLADSDCLPPSFTRQSKLARIFNDFWVVNVLNFGRR